MAGTFRTWSPPHSAVERLRLFALHGTEVLGEKIARSLGCHLGTLEERSFEVFTALSTLANFRTLSLEGIDLLIAKLEAEKKALHSEE